ncbi:MAG: hypothetical protein N3H31_07010, partial [Candidatus Nezhaarchaeota archaeon]|nr:hypothetical protein [Candidatus Nezhaarchaeota archaeon]
PVGEEFRPVFFVLSGGLTGYNAWEVVEGPRPVPARGEAVFTLRPLHPSLSIPPGRAFKVLVLDLERRLVRGVSSVECLRPSSYAWPRNPDLLHWAYSVVKGVYEPLAWSFVYNREVVEEVAELVEANGTALLRVAGAKRGSGEWLMAGLWQSVELPSTLRLRVKPMFSTQLSTHPSRLVGVEIGWATQGVWDWGEHRRVSNYTNLPYKAIWVLFTNETSEPSLVRRGEGLALLFIPVRVGEWCEVEVNVTKALLDLGWSLPEPRPFTAPDGPLAPRPWAYFREEVVYVGRRAELTLFVAAYPWDLDPAAPKEAYFDLVSSTH